MGRIRACVVAAGVVVGLVAAIATTSASALHLGFLEQAPGVARASADVSICRGMRTEQRGRFVQVAAAGGYERSGILLADATSGTASADDNLDLFEKLGLMEGHLMIGKALLDANMQKDALPHFGHPVRELYDYLKPAFAERKHPEFEKELQDLERRAKAAPRDPVTTAAYNDVLNKVDGLRKTIPAETLRSRQFVILGIAMMVEAAAGDLGESLDKGRITNTMEYHDAMGFARYADAYARAQADILGPQTVAIAKETQFTLSAFPSLEPPSKPARSVSQVQAAANRVKALAN
jgi:hypothetical protein